MFRKSFILGAFGAVMMVGSAEAQRDQSPISANPMTRTDVQTAMHPSVHNHFNHQRSIETRARFKQLRNTALLEWRELTAA